MPLTTVPATEDDTHKLAEIKRQSYNLEIPSRITWKNWRGEDNMRIFFTARLQKTLTREGARCFKALLRNDLGEAVVGFICLTVREVPGTAINEASPTTTAKAALLVLPAGAMNIDFVKEAGATMEKLLDLMTEKHYYISTFAVPSKHQGSGIGTALLQHFLQVVHREGLPCWLIAFPGSRSLYMRHGFVDKAFRDVDLNAWDESRYRGFGMYRNYAMPAAG